LRAEVSLLVAHAVLLGWLLVQGPLAGSYSTPWTGQDPSASDHRFVVRDPHSHLPLEGMPGFSGDRADACLRMEGFLVTAAEALARAGVSPPLPPHQVPGRVEGTSCAVYDPALTPLIREFDAAWRRAGLPAAGPLGR